MEDSVVIKEDDKTINLGATISSIGLWSDFLELDPKTYQPIPPGPLEVIDHGQMRIHDCSEFASFASCSSECFSVQTDDLVLHFGADWIRVYQCCLIRCSRGIIIYFYFQLEIKNISFEKYLFYIALSHIYLI